MKAKLRFLKKVCPSGKKKQIRKLINFIKLDQIKRFKLF